MSPRNALRFVPLVVAAVVACDSATNPTNPNLLTSAQLEHGSGTACVAGGDQAGKQHEPGGERPEPATDRVDDAARFQEPAHVLVPLGRVPLRFLIAKPAATPTGQAAA